MAKKENRKDIPISREEEEFQRLVRKRHIELFPEEYDHMFDSFSDARERQKGRNPTNPKDIARINESRVKMGFEPLSERGYAVNQDTYRYVEQRLRAGEELSSVNSILNHIDAEKNTDPDRQKRQKFSDSTSTLDSRIDGMLAGEAFINGGQDRSDPQIIAFRVLGELFKINHSGDNEAELLRQISRLLPDEPETKHKELCRYAIKKWVEIYGY
jgi:hypothetical protein